MLPRPDNLSLPFREGIRDIRCSIRSEARSGALAIRLFGTSRPTRRLARLADEMLSHAEKAAERMLSHAEAGLEERLDRLMAGLLTGRLAERSGDAYAVCRAILDADEASGVLVSEFKLAVQGADRAAAPVEDPILAAVGQAQRMASGGILRRCLSTAILPYDGEAAATRDARLALTCWLAVLVRAETRAEADLVLDSSALAVAAEGEEWVRLLRERRLGELAEVWRRTVPHLP
jgi:hypothetical protein